MKVTLKQHDKVPGAAPLAALEHLVVLLPASRRHRPPPGFTDAGLLLQRLHRALGDDATGPFATDLPNRRATHVVLALADDAASPFTLLTLARKLLAPVLQRNPRRIGLLVAGFAPEPARRAAEALVAAALAGHFTLPTLKSTPARARRLNTIDIYGVAAALDTERLTAEAEGNHLARSLTTLPPNLLTPGEYRRRIALLARQQGWRMSTLNSRALQRLKAGAFLAVAQGSAHDDASIVHLRYTPPRARRAPRLALVGKGICFDTGGMNLKSAKHMHGMHEDMEGSAVALGTLLALSRLKVPFAVDCWLALAQNHIGPHAYKQNDVVTACDGTTIEVVHTDAEGRMVLADTLALASRAKPHLIIDYATLTGACVYALGTRYSGAFTNREALIAEVIAAGRESGERVWPFPLDEDYEEALQSTIADIKQCTLEGEADHILGARFLKRFVADRPWLHIDLSAGNNKGGLAHIPSDVTGFGVRFTLNLLLDRKIMDGLRSD
ncbi:MAG: leucyl aminopeptidase family protein [Gammaproteobacteria bacterium]|nr:leucyl aminopeptidase family protein [Gammaproteobacteria bacterium]